jgi:hypothetical protein
VKCLVQAGVANGVSFVASITGAAVGAVIPLPFTTVICSILFAFIGYVIARWGSGALVERLQRMIESDSDDVYMNADQEKASFPQLQHSH